MAESPQRRFGWVPDRPDQRDLLYSAPLERLGPLPPKLDMRAQCPPVYDQGQLGSCTANAIGAALQFVQMAQKVQVITPARLFIYYNERAMEGTLDSDSGAMIRDGIKSVGKLGVCPEETWPYDITKFRDKPTPACYQEALKHQAILYRRVPQNLVQMKGCLASGFPFVLGFTVYESFMSDQVAKTGEVPMPALNESGPYGEPPSGHAVMAVGYDDTARRFLVRNSWGTGWGVAGYFTMPYEYLTQSNLSSDFWTIRVVE